MTSSDCKTPTSIEATPQALRSKGIREEGRGRSIERRRVSAITTILTGVKKSATSGDLVRYFKALGDSGLTGEWFFLPCDCHWTVDRQAAREVAQRETEENGDANDALFVYRAVVAISSPAGQVVDPVEDALVRLLEAPTLNDPASMLKAAADVSTTLSRTSRKTCCRRRVRIS